MYVNEGQRPFTVAQDNKQLLSKLRAADRKHYKLVGLRSHLRKACPKCGRHGACNHRQFNASTEWHPDKPVLFVKYQACTNCGEQVDTTHTICHSCGLYNPFKVRVKAESKVK